jgi:hypothetical protein
MMRGREKGIREDRENHGSCPRVVVVVGLVSIESQLLFGLTDSNCETPPPQIWHRYYWNTFSATPSPLNNTTSSFR